MPTDNQTADVVVSVEMFPPRIGMTSCVGIGVRGPEDYPLEFGNYCSISSRIGAPEVSWSGPYLCNMWAENLKEWARRNPDVAEIEITVVSHVGKSIGFVSDPRLKDWCNKNFCVTGNGWPSVAAMRKVVELTDLPPDWSCGCEKDDMAPQHWCRYDKHAITRTCHHCNKQETQSLSKRADDRR